MEFAVNKYQVMGAWYNPWSWGDEAIQTNTAPTNPISATWQASAKIANTAGSATSLVMWGGALALVYVFYIKARKAGK